MKYVTLFVILIVAALGACTKSQNTGSGGNHQAGPLVVEGFLVEPQTISENIEVPGSLLPEEETQLRAEVSGRIVQLNIQEGSVVQKGQIMVKLFDQDLQAQLQKLQVQLKIAEKTEERQRELLAINGISQQEYDLSILNVENLKADILAVRISISKTEIRAPYDGRIGLRYVSPGAYLSSNDIIATVRKVDRLKLEFSIPEKYAKEIKKGESVHFRVDGGSETHKGTVMATENSVDQTTRTLKVRALVTAGHKELVPGVFARVNLPLGVTHAGLLVPTQAILPQARNKQVMVLRKDSIHYTIVETGLRDSAFVQITRGLKEGDTVITTGLMAIRPNSRVKIGELKRYK
ncbi:MAG: efflux RND transporter periplasmic adaptor subunit [Cyclobacteriaceae bacterium]|nr:efflux RND transporter periplasmic adaptor subunit [Cyclobacteriaceae bacterium]